MSSSTLPQTNQHLDPPLQSRMDPPTDWEEGERVVAQDEVMLLAHYRERKRDLQRQEAAFLKKRQLQSSSSSSPTAASESLKSPCSSIHYPRRWAFTLLVLLALVAGFVYFSVVKEEQTDFFGTSTFSRVKGGGGGGGMNGSSSIKQDKNEMGGETTSALAADQSANENPKPPPQQQEQTAAEDTKASTLASIVERMTKQFAQARQDFQTNLQQQYGINYYDVMFLHKLENGTQVTAGRLAFQSPTENGPSRDRMRQKLLMKLLQAVVQESSSTTSRTRRLDESKYNDMSRDLSEDNKENVTFVWATGGHSSAAGHGNLFHESYTADLERALKPVFLSLNIHMEGRNYAMGGTASWPELALCVDEIFGTDIDVLSWDFGMTDGDKFHGMLQYFYHAGLNPNRPACIGLQLAQAEPAGPRFEVLQALEERGVTTLHLDQQVFDRVVEGIPDTFGMNEEQLKALPPLIRNFKCEGALEKGDPYCKKEKYNADFCPNRKYKVSWHEGWKWHALMGNLMAFGLVELIEDALNELVSLQSSISDPSAFLAQLQDQEVKLYEQLLTLEIPSIANGYMKDLPEGGFDLEMFYKKKTNCHIALLPSEIRYKGIFTDTQTLVGSHNYDKGISMQELKNTPGETEFMSLSYDDRDRQKCPDPVDLNMDYKDFFLVQEREGPKKLVVPTDAELKAYPHKKRSLEGRIMVCFAVCPWNKCEDGDKDLKADAITAGHIKIQINGVEVTSVDNVAQCSLFLHGQREVKFPPNADGRFEIQVHVTREDSFAEFTSFIVW